MTEPKNSPMLAANLVRLAGIEALQHLPGKALMISNAEGACLFASTIATVISFKNGVRLETTGGDTLEISADADAYCWQLIPLPRLYSTRAMSITREKGTAVWLNGHIVFNQQGLAHYAM